MCGQRVLPPLLTDSLFSTSSFSSSPWDVFNVIPFYSLPSRTERCHAKIVNTHPPPSHTFIPCLPFPHLLPVFLSIAWPLSVDVLSHCCWVKEHTCFSSLQSPLQVPGRTIALFSVTPLFPFLRKHTWNGYSLPGTLLSTKDRKTNKTSLFQLEDPSN